MPRVSVRRTRRPSGYRFSASSFRKSSRASAAWRARRAPNRARRGLMLSPGELKAVDTTTAQNINSTSAVTLINGIARGDDISDRVGRQITMKSISVRGQMAVTAGTGVDQAGRVLIVYDKQANAAAPTAAQVISAAGDGYDIYRPPNLENRMRFVILYDRTFRLNASAEPSSVQLVTCYRRVNLVTTFNSGDAGTVADIVTGSLYLVSVGNVAAGATAAFLNVATRVRFEDK